MKRSAMIVLGICAVTVLAVTAYVIGTLPDVRPLPRENHGLPHASVYLTARLSFVFWFLAELRRLRCREDGTTRVLSLTGLVFLIEHTLVVLHGLFEWSMPAAYDFIANQGGFGPGLYVNFAVVGLWVFDWLMIGRQSTWYTKANRFAIAFVLLNATVVFAFTWFRYPAAVAFAGLLVAWVRLNVKQTTTAQTDSDRNRLG
jgi:hypothetical protein